MTSSTPNGIEIIREAARQAPPYPKPGDPKENTGFNSLDMHQILRAQRMPAVRTKLTMGGKPQAAQLPDGTVVVAGFIEPPIHPTSCITMQWSTDRGATFSEPKIFEEMPGRTCGFKCLHDGTLILGHGDAPPWISRSTDGGHSWTSTTIGNDIIPGKPAGKRPDDGLGIGESNGVLELPDGTLLQHVFRFHGEYRWSAFLVRSTDGGNTWGDPTPAATGTDADEIYYERLSSGRLIGIGRCSGAYIHRNHLEDAVPGGHEAPMQGEPGDSPSVFYSDDDGHTWTAPRPTGLGVLMAASYPLELPDGRVLLIIGHRQLPFGVQAVASRDDGQSWDLDQPLVLAQHSWSFYCGHPRSCLLDDGSILTGYYTHQDYAPAYPCTVCGSGQAMGSHGGKITGELIRWWPPSDWP